MLIIIIIKLVKCSVFNYPNKLMLHAEISVLSQISIPGNVEID